MTASMFGFGRLSAEGKVGIASGVVFFSMLISRTLISEQVDKNTGALLFRIQFVLFINSLLLLGSLYIWKRVPPRVVEVEIPMEKLPEPLSGLKLVLLSDIHLGPTIGYSKLQQIITMVNELDPDVVVIVGDLTDSQVTRLRSAAEPLGQLKVRLGSYFATGNHDYYTADVEGWFELLRSMGIQPLHNSHAKVFRPEQPQDWICLAGIDDLEASMLRYPGHGMDVEKALSGCSAESPIILLAHQPHAAKQALQQRPDISLVLSGHTHAGQLFPLTILAFLANPFFCGLYRVSEHTMVYVTPGTGYYGIPMRIASHSEITKIILKRA
ncbi:Transmembrane protein with metallophosphoesterase domain [Triplophysa tibetana]|uniref:Transmembrane protein with metallophosphoesterase domain n=1 Tax=Triplophysa tibetana TaxID=1572043 RepID=A0A5A9PM85_9TELE|nr:Transmembrane protein with metallophosphoesterase domain [Triplophysa tibetana]